MFEKAYYKQGSGVFRAFKLGNEYVCGFDAYIDEVGRFICSYQEFIGKSIEEIDEAMEAIDAYPF